MENKTFHCSAEIPLNFLRINWHFNNFKWNLTRRTFSAIISLLCTFHSVEVKIVKEKLYVGVIQTTPSILKAISMLELFIVSLDFHRMHLKICILCYVFCFLYPNKIIYPIIFLSFFTKNVNVLTYSKQKLEIMLSTWNT